MSSQLALTLTDFMFQVGYTTSTWSVTDTVACPALRLAISLHVWRISRMFHKVAKKNLNFYFELLSPATLFSQQQPIRVRRRLVINDVTHDNQVHLQAFTQRHFS